MGAPPGRPEAALRVNKGSSGAGNGQVTTPRRFRNPAAGCGGPSTPILIRAQRQHPRSPHRNARSEAVALRTLPPEVHRGCGVRPCPVPTPEAASGFWQLGTSPPSRQCRGSVPRSRSACSGHPGTSRRWLEAARAATPAVLAAPASPRATTSLCHCSQQRKHVTVGPKHLASPTLGQWWGRQPLPRAPWEM